MTIDLHIERLVIEGLALSSTDGRMMEAAVAAELTRLLAAGPIPPAARASGVWPSVPALALPGAATREPRQLGRAIASGVYRSLGGRRG